MIFVDKRLVIVDLVLVSGRGTIETRLGIANSIQERMKGAGTGLFCYK